MIQYAFRYHKEIENCPKQVSNTRPFIDLYNWDVIKYRIAINNNNCSLLEEKIVKLL